LVPIQSLWKMVLASLMAALTAVGAYIYVPIGPVPVVLTTLFVLLAGLLLGSRWGVASILLYLLVGAMGFPVFAGGRGGIAHFLGPTGGYLLGYAFASLITGFISEHARGLFGLEILAAVLGTLVIYAFGVPWLKVVGQIPWSKAWMVGALPFLPGDAIKGAVALGLARSVRPILTRHQQVLSS